MLGDYYPLTSYNQGADVWMAWQFDRPELSGGMIQAFRRAESSALSYQFRLRGLDPQGRYELTDYEENKTIKMTGKKLMDQGLTIQIDTQPGSALIQYKKIN